MFADSATASNGRFVLPVGDIFIFHLRVPLNIAVIALIITC